MVINKYISNKSFLVLCGILFVHSVTHVDLGAQEVANSNSTTTKARSKFQVNSNNPAIIAAAGKIIRNINIEIGDVFDADETGVYGMVNQLKINSKKEVIERELLFKSGDTLDSFLVDETLRVLRSLAYIRKVSITPQVDGQFVDLNVKVSDTWTLIPQANYSSGDGRDRRAIGLAESNLMGYGNRIEGLYRIDDDTTSVELVYDDRRFLDTDYDMTLGIFDRDDGNRYLFSFEEPFRSLVDTQAWSTRAESIDGLARLYQNAEENFIYRSESLKLDASLTSSRGNPTEKLNRYSIGYRFMDSSFSEATAAEIEDLDVDEELLNQDPTRLATDRRYSGPIFAYSNIEPDYVSMNYIDRFDRVQDFNLGDQFGALAHLAPRFFGSKVDTLLYAASKSKGFRVSDSSFLRSEAIASGRVGDGGFDNTLVHGELLYYNVLGPIAWRGMNLGRHTLAASWFLDWGDNFDQDRQLSLGADNGLRGYDARTFNGDKRTLLNLEHRIHMIDDAWQLISVGLSPFIDVGGATNESFPSLFQDELYADFGIGFIFGFPRSSGSRVLRIDLAMPIRDADDGTNSFKLRFIFSSGQTFNAQTTTEQINAQKPSVAVGF